MKEQIDTLKQEQMFMKKTIHSLSMQLESVYKEFSAFREYVAMQYPAVMQQAQLNQARPMNPQMPAPLQRRPSLPIQQPRVLFVNNDASSQSGSSAVLQSCGCKCM
jgi:hypothetical protein